VRARAVGVLFALIALACRPGSGRLATVGDLTITDDDLADAVSAQTGEPAEQAAPSVVAALFDDLLEEDVLLAASSDPGDHALAPAERSARARDLLTTLCPAVPTPTPADIDAYLAQHPEASDGGERLLLRQLILPDAVTARAARDKLRQGGDFVALSRELSRAPNAADGGRIGWVDHGQLPPKFEAAVFGLSVGEVSDPVESNAGWHVFQVTDRRSGEAPAADREARERAEGELAAAAAERTRHTCIATLAAKVGVEVDCRSASFPCRNPFLEAR
jgi:PPIC-type PPIASE domain